MTSNRWNYLYEKSFHLHRMNDHDDLNLYYRKFLNKLSKICLKIFLPLLSLLYLFTLFLCRFLLTNPTTLTFDLRTIFYVIGIFFTFILLFLIRLHTKWKTLWFCTRVFLVFLLIIPLILTYQTDQYHLLLSTISITLIYSLSTFTLIQSFVISLTISLVHLGLLLYENKTIHWFSLEFFSLILYHLIINLAGLSIYIRSIKHIRQHFQAYETNLYEKNRFSVDCKKLNTILGHCQQTKAIGGRMSKLSHGFHINASSTSPSTIDRKFATVINCNLSLNEQTRLHTSDELASLFDVLYCQIEQFIVKQHSQAKYSFDNETIVIYLFNENENETQNIDQTCCLAIELFRFIQHVNNVTQWSLTAIIGIDYNELFVLSSDCFEGLASDYARWLREECLIINRLHVSSRIYNALKETKFYEFHSYSWTTNKTSLDGQPTYFLFSTNMYEPLTHFPTSINNSSMIDQLTRIQAQYHVEKHLGTITLTRSLRKRSLIELTTKHFYWSTLSFKDSYVPHGNSFQIDFQSTHRATNPSFLFYFFIVLCLIGTLVQASVIDHFSLYYLILIPSSIIGLVIIVNLFRYSIKMEQNQFKFELNRNNQKFYVYLNVLICLTFSTIFLVAIQYHSIHNFKYLFQTDDLTNDTLKSLTLNMSSSQMNTTWNNNNDDNLGSLIISSIPSTSFDRQYHDYLIISPIFLLYLCSLYRQCSWMIKTFFIICCLIIQSCLLEYIWLTTHFYFPSISSLHHYTALTLIVIHGLLLIISVYVREWLEKIDFVWLKQIDNERLVAQRQREDLIKQTSLFLPTRVIHYYLRTDSDLARSQHYHHRYERMALLNIRFYPTTIDHQYILVDFLNDIEYLLKTNEKYADIVLHRKSTIKELTFSVDIDQDESIKCLQQLVELLFQIDERLKQLSSSSINLAACLHIGCVQEILIHFEHYPKVDLWSEHIALLQLLMTKTQPNHCLTTASVYHLLNDLYLFRTAGSIVSTQTNAFNNTNIYYLLGRLIGDNVFQGRNALPLTIGHNHTDTVQKSTTTDESHHSQSSQMHCKLNGQREQNPIQTSTTTTTTTTSSSVILNEQQSLLKQSSSSSRKHVRISNHSSSAEHPSYRHTLLQALNNNSKSSPHQMSPLKKISNRLTHKKHTTPPMNKESYLPRMIHLSDNSCWSSREGMTTSETSGSKCLILTQKMINGSTDDNSRSRSPLPVVGVPMVNRHLSSERKSFTEEDFRQLLHGQSSKEMNNPSRSLSTTNEETASSFSGWDDVPPSPLMSIKSNTEQNQPSESIKPKPPSPLVDCYYPRRPCDLSFTVNMTTTEDETSSRTETKSTVIASPTSTVVTLTSPTVPVPTPVPTVKTPVQLSQPQQAQMSKYRPVPFNLARKLIAETSESALSDISVEQQREPWTQNVVYQSRQPQRTRLSSSYSNLHDLVQNNESLKYLPDQSHSPTLVHSDLLQRWLEDQLNMFRCQVQQTPPVANRKANRFSTNVILRHESTDDESDTISENTFTTRTNPNHPVSKSSSVSKRPYNHVRYKPLRRSSINTSHLVRHESLKYRNRPLLLDKNPTFPKSGHHSYPSKPLKNYPRRTDSSSMPRSDLSDISSSRPDNLSESVISNLESEYDNIYTQTHHGDTPVTIMSNSQILSDDDDDDDETTLATTITAIAKKQCYF